MDLTAKQRRQLYSIFSLIRDKMPSENTEDRLVERSKLPPKLVALAIQILYNEGEGWLEFDSPRRFDIRGYYVKKGKGQKTVDHLPALFKAWQATEHAPVGGMRFDQDPDDPDDVWVEGPYED